MIKKLVLLSEDKTTELFTITGNFTYVYTGSFFRLTCDTPVRPDIYQFRIYFNDGTVATSRFTFFFQETINIFSRRYNSLTFLK